MPELRWTLLILGVVFVAVLAWWERRRPHQASRQSPHIGGESRTGTNNDPSWGPDTESAGSRVMREPTLTLPEIRVREPTSPRDLPIVEISDDSLMGLRVDGDRVEERVGSQEATAKALAAEAAIFPIAPALPAARPEPEPLPPAAPVVQPPVLPPAPVVGVQPIVDWPPEDERRLMALRLVAPPSGRFLGRAVRQALAAEGFVLGKFDIFHKPDSENRAVLSAASLTKPGTFDLETMDSQRFVGLNLFAVLPGPKTPLKAFEDLLITARMLNERLEGALQDERGGPLTPTRIAALRDGLGAEADS